jgi:hypothetical protein
VPPNPANHPGLAAYTVPAVLFPDGQAMIDSAAIATELERRYPSPGVSGIPAHSTEIPLPDSPAAAADPALARTAEFMVLHAELTKPFRAVIAPRVVENVVTDVSRPKKAEGLGGKTLEEAKAEVDVARAIKELEPPLRAMSAFWERQGGAFGEDGKLSWAAVQQLSSLHFASIGTPDMFQHMMEAEGAEGMKKLYGTAKERGWFDRDDY